jgi:hypothetical protein
VVPPNHGHGDGDHVRRRRGPGDQAPGTGTATAAGGHAARGRDPHVRPRRGVVGLPAQPLGSGPPARPRRTGAGVRRGHRAPGGGRRGPAAAHRRRGRAHRPCRRHAGRRPRPAGPHPGTAGIAVRRRLADLGRDRPLVGLRRGGHRVAGRAVVHPARSGRPVEPGGTTRVVRRRHGRGRRDDRDRPARRRAGHLRRPAGAAASRVRVRRWRQRGARRPRVPAPVAGQQRRPRGDDVRHDQRSAGLHPAGRARGLRRRGLATRRGDHARRSTPTRPGRRGVRGRSRGTRRVPHRCRAARRRDPAQSQRDHRGPQRLAGRLGPAHLAAGAHGRAGHRGNPGEPGGGTGRVGHTWPAHGQPACAELS